jgi:hypothetical protein
MDVLHVLARAGLVGLPCWAGLEPAGAGSESVVGSPGWKVARAGGTLLI